MTNKYLKMLLYFCTTFIIVSLRYVNRTLLKVHRQILLKPET